MKITEYTRNMSISFTFRGHEFQLERDAYFNYDWYIQVNLIEHGHTYDGWWNDSGDKSMREAILEACKGSQIDPPKRWPKLELDS